LLYPSIQSGTYRITQDDDKFPRLSEESTCPSGIVLHTPVSQDSTGLAVTSNEESGKRLNISFLVSPSYEEQRARLVRMTTTYNLKFTT